MGSPGLVFAHDDAPALKLEGVEVAAGDVERLRGLKVASIAPEAIETARLSTFFNTSKGSNGVETLYVEDRVGKKYATKGLPSAHSR